MNYELIYDAATSEAPRSTLMFGLALLAVSGVWVAWLKRRNSALHGGVKFLAGIAAFFILLSGVYRLEQRYIAQRTDILALEGTVTDHWEDRERRVGSDSNDYWHYEGFRISGIPFSYTRNAEQNYFHNGGSRSIEIEDGLRLRIRYVHDDGRNQIVSVEIAAPHTPNLASN